MELYDINNNFLRKVNSTPDDFTGIAVVGKTSKMWLLNGKFHRLDGPAIDWYSGWKKWFVYGESVTEEQCKLLYGIMKLKGLL